MNDPRQLARIFKVLSVETRVRMLDMLKGRCLCVNALARALEITPAAVSQHLRVLRDVGIVQAERKGYFVHYRVDQTTLADWGQAAQQLLGPCKTGVAVCPPAGDPSRPNLRNDEGG